ncbi:MAG: 3-dehydroquinate synthase [Clostridia bacterium]|nr:3-dehydroquinate synthase [Clostridia bacterium]
MRIPVKTATGGYDILLERGALHRAGELMNLHRRVLIVTDSGVPTQYAQTIAAQCTAPTVITIPQGEASKCSDRFLELLGVLTENGFTRTDCVVAVGGGVVGDLAGFAAACFMRGIDFYNVPTTLLSQVDSSIGGKTAIDFGGYKNIVGAFWPPRAVLIDPNTLDTLPPRQLANGMAEAVKMALTHDPALFAMFESGAATQNLETIIERALLIKRAVVEQDEREGGLRRVLNFGHTLAHAVESAEDMAHYYHGECVAIGMLPMCSDAVRARLLPVLKGLGLPTAVSGEPTRIIEALAHDKKADGQDISVVYVPEIGTFTFKKLPLSELAQQIERGIRE